MLHTALGVFILAHAAVTGVIWLAPLTDGAPFNPSHSWLLGDSRAIAAPVSTVLAVGLAVAGVALLGHQAWWAPVGLAFASAAVAFMLLYFDPWLLAGIAINAGLAIAALNLPNA